jgi:integrase
MAKRKTLTDTMIRKLKPAAKRLTMPDPEMRGHYIRVTPTGAKSYVAVARDPVKKTEKGHPLQVWTTLGSTDHYSVAEAREQAREVIRRIKDGLDAFEPPPVQPDSFEAVAENWMRRHVQAKRLRSEYEIARILKKHVYPAFGDREFETIKRSDVTRLLDLVEDESGPRQADCVLGVLRGLMNWHAARVDDFVPPIVRGMRRDDPHARKRARILDDDEIRRLWGAADTSGAFGAFVKLALLTAQRRQKIVSMKWADVAIDGTWSIATEAREKGTGGDLVLPEVAIEVIRSQPVISGNPYVFPGRGDGHSNAHHVLKRRIDNEAQLAPWVLHDLRRTSRSLMARANVRRDVAERVLGHVIQGVEGTYDRHEYRDEKADALAKLAGLIALILDPPSENVVPIGTAQ